MYFLVKTQLWIWDREVTSSMVLNTVLDSHSGLRFIFLCLEWSMHGAFSLGFLVSMRYNFSTGTRYELAVLALVQCAFEGLCADLVIVGIIKGTVRRLRPPFDIKDQLYEAPLVDKFSFPSGHSSRGAMLSVLCLNMCSLPYFIAPLVRLFPFVLGASRIFIGRHYVGDVIVGLLLGYAEGNFVQYLPLHTIELSRQVFATIFSDDQLRIATCEKTRHPAALLLFSCTTLFVNNRVPMNSGPQLQHILCTGHGHVLFGELIQRIDV
uniref:Phosphatidic acid phosphatase type 2/haloperoxidase domain-containing protein n=1 Tax=Setaria digitata TaxID=48799 RepID=A0A915PMB9_9BILA